MYSLFSTFLGPGDYFTSILLNMAELQLSLNSFKQQFDDQLTCSVCLDQYTYPKTLPCHHSFCLECIQPLPVEIKVKGTSIILCSSNSISFLNRIVIATSAVHHVVSITYYLKEGLSIYLMTSGSIACLSYETN